MMIPLSRRELLARTGTGLGVLGLASLLADESRAAAVSNPSRPGRHTSPRRPSTSFTCS